ncbi:MAG: tetratricopeptide repeat protein [Candidatus Hydrogenedentota bacterium]|nr:MAG: tetratricopeptide repeat protein [Candidatus Hydrogenedentota bacterium]
MFVERSLVSLAVMAGVILGAAACGGSAWSPRPRNKAAGISRAAVVTVAREKPLSGSLEKRARKSERKVLQRKETGFIAKNPGNSETLDDTEQLRLPEFGSVDELYRYGVDAMRRGDHSLAVAVFTEVSTRRPQFARAFVNKARVLLRLGKFRSALDAARKGVELDYRSADAQNVLARCYHNLGLVRQAEETYRTALEIDSAFPWAWNNLALLEIEKGEYEKAVPMLRKAVALDSSVPTYHNNLGVALEKTGRIREARAQYRAAVEADPSYRKAIASLERLKGLPDRIAIARKEEKPAGDFEVTGANDVRNEEVGDDGPNASLSDRIEAGNGSERVEERDANAEIGRREPLLGGEEKGSPRAAAVLETEGMLPN